MARLYLILFLILPFFTPQQIHAQEKLRVVQQVIDGDTIVLQGGEVLRLIGVEAPPFPKSANKKSAADAWAQRSQAFTKDLVEGRKVWLKYGKVKKDKQGRTWAYVFFKISDTQTLGAGGEKFLATAGTYMVNRLIVRYGMATSGNPFSFQYRSQFKQLELNAREARTGLFQSNF